MVPTAYFSGTTLKYLSLLNIWKFILNYGITEFGKYWEGEIYIKLKIGKAFKKKKLLSSRNIEKLVKLIKKAVAILPSTAIYPQRLFCRELIVIGQSK